MSYSYLFVNAVENLTLVHKFRSMVKVTNPVRAGIKYYVIDELMFVPSSHLELVPGLENGFEKKLGFLKKPQKSKI